jgi:hypothetical protein
MIEAAAREHRRGGTGRAARLGAVTRKSAAVMRKPTTVSARHPEDKDRTNVEGGGSVGGRLGLWAALAGITGAGVAIALRRSKAKAEAAAEAADRGEPVPHGDRLAASFKAREYAREQAQPPAHVSMTAAEFEYDRHGATVLGSAHPAPGAGHSRTERHPNGHRLTPVDEEPGRAGLA